MSSPYSMRLNDSCDLRLSVGDLTHWTGAGFTRAAIVNAANESLLGGSGVDGAIHRAAGPGLKQECLLLPEGPEGERCPVGEARITSGQALPVPHVIHTVGPRYANENESAPLLRAAYESSLKLAAEEGLEAIAFPAISCGIFGYPLAQASAVALQACESFSGALKLVEFVLFKPATQEVWAATARSLFEGWFPCPTCQLPHRTTPRYPWAVCPSCSKLACDQAGRALKFGNLSVFGGFSAQYADSGENYPGGGTCWVSGVLCEADEARFGGIVIQTVGPEGQ